MPRGYFLKNNLGEKSEDREALQEYNVPFKFHDP